jgi:hypothetical protein
MADDLLTLAAKIRARSGGVELSTDFLYASETGLPEWLAAWRVIV